MSHAVETQPFFSKSHAAASVVQSATDSTCISDLSVPQHSEKGRRERSEEKQLCVQRRARARLICGQFGCLCCGPARRSPPRSELCEFLIPPLTSAISLEAAKPTDEKGCERETLFAIQCAELDGSRDAPYVDTHIHLEMVLQKLRWYQSAPSFSERRWERLTESEQQNWRQLGLSDLNWNGATAKKGANKTWFIPWKRISDEQRIAAQALGWNPAKWDGYHWLLPTDVLWYKLDDTTRRHLTVLGETRESWDEMFGPNKPAGFCDGGDMRRWEELTYAERHAASELGFSPPTWNMEELADISGYVNDFCGSGFQGAICQGCDSDSIDDCVTLALAHPQVYAAFGCHPKNAWLYKQDNLEERFLAAFDACGKKACAWGEFGLDFSNERYWDDKEYIQGQIDVFERQIELALERDLPLVLHIREAADETLAVLKKRVPRHWKAHVHGFHGPSEFVEACLALWPNFYFGLTGTVSMGATGDGTRLAKIIPLERMVLETDGPYLLPRGTSFNHAGQIPLIARLVAKARQCPAEDVLTKSRENSRFIYGF